MIWRASSRFSAVGGLPSTLFVASSVTRVPPMRSRPSRGSSRSFRLPLAPREEHQKVEDDEDEPEHGELPPGAHLSLRWCHGCPVSLYGRAAARSGGGCRAGGPGRRVGPGRRRRPTRRTGHAGMGTPTVTGTCRRPASTQLSSFHVSSAAPSGAAARKSGRPAVRRTRHRPGATGHSLTTSASSVDRLARQLRAGDHPGDGRAGVAGLHARSDLDQDGVVVDAGDRAVAGRRW